VETGIIINVKMFVHKESLNVHH